jgi:hypothetical protein
MAEAISLSGWVLEPLRDIANYFTYWYHLKAAGSAGKLMFFRPGMLKTLEKMAAGDASEADQRGSVFSSIAPSGRSTRSSGS